MKRLLITLFTLVFIGSCVTGDQKTGDGYIIVKNVSGINEDDAEINAKRKIIENGIGELVEGSSTVIDGESKEKVINSSVEGIVFDYQQIGPTRKKGENVEIDAKGKVNMASLKDALSGVMSEQGLPNFLMLVEERVNGKLSDGSVTTTEGAFVATYKELNFLDKAQFIRILQKEGGKTIGVYGNAKEEDKALTAAAEMEAQILLIGKTDSKNIGEIEGSGLYSNQATLQFKIVDVGSGQIIAAENSTSAFPHVSPDSGAIEAIKRAIDKTHDKIAKQIADKWKGGAVIRITIEGMKYDDYIDKGVSGIIRSIKGVNAVNDKSSGNTNGAIYLEAKAKINGTVLYRKMRERKSDFGFEFTGKDVKPGSISIVVKK